MSSLPSDSHTARRLEHATPEHLHLTTRRTFIGPIPEGWLSSHRKSWYKSYIRDGRNRAPTFTAAHPIASANDATQNGGLANGATQDGGLAVPEQTPRPSSQSADTRTQTESGGATTSTTSLLHSQRASAVREPSPDVATEQNAPESAATLAHRSVQEDGPVQRRPTDQLRLDKVASKLTSPKVRFSEATKLQLRSRAKGLAARGSFKSSKIKPGELMKMDKMLVRIDVTKQTIREDLDENVSQGVETKSLDKWREFMVACRKHTEGAVLQLYQTRVIATTADKTKKKPKAEIIMSQSRANVNMFSSLDKTLCIWTPADKGRTYIYYLRPQSGAASVEWFTFLNSVLGRGRARTLQVNVPDLSASLRLDDPFKTLETSKVLAEAAEGDDDALAKAVSDEKGAAGAIVTRCIEMLSKSPEWADVLRAWAQYDRIGLAWKRYDRLEWVHGAVEQNMYGTIAMARTHDLELRPKDHYPLHAKTHKGHSMQEPAPVEGFLIRLTSQKGQARRMGKMLFKRLYFTSQNQYLIFTRPARASPPPPPKMAIKRNGSIPSTKQLVDEAPLTYDIDPYPLEGKRISWLDIEGVKSTSEQLSHDEAAAQEAERNTNMLVNCDGFIDMGTVKRVRKFHKGAIAIDDNMDSGSDVDFHESARDHRGPDGRTKEVDEDRIFELLLKNGLVVRLQAYNEAAKLEWMKRLRELVKYWHHRAKEDMDLFKSVRQQNLDALQIDERAEAQVGSFAYKWEVSQSVASPTMYNLCGIASCRTIHMSGTLFRKPRRHTTFTRCHVILSAGHLLIFQDTLRKRTGQKLVHIHLERIGSVDLKGCYLYSGLLTENDLLYQNQTFDSNMPGHHALPRIYLEDAWTSTDEDAMTTFVIWHAKSKSWFRSSQTVDDARTAERQNADRAEQGRDVRTKTKLERVSKLGTTGRSVVFKARSRAERDHWVLAIQVEIERLASQDAEVRLIDAGEK